MKRHVNAILGLLALCAPIAAAPAAWAEATTIKIVVQPAFAFLPLYVMQQAHLIEKNAADLGIKDLKVEWPQMSGDDAVNDALLSGAADIVCGGTPSFLRLWDRTWQTPQEVRAVAAMGYFDVLLNSRDPNIKTIADFKPGDRIAISAVKVSFQALVLQMAAAKQWGIENYDKLDNLTFAMSPPDQTTAILSGDTSVKNVFGSAPFSLMQLKDANVHTVLRASDLIGNATSPLTWTTKKFHDANPTIFKAVIKSLEDAQHLIDTNLSQAIDYYLAGVSVKVIDKAGMQQMLSDPAYGYNIVPHGLTVYSDFLSKTGRLDHKPSSWEDLFFPEVYGWNGN